ncbi:MAG: glycine--tRNA ligase subunit beta [Myxococcales bacterium]|nr:glycine--tRNA ligase subunit beta [Myxococcales bacterium]
MAETLLLEIGTEELPASFVAAGVEALPALIRTKLSELRLAHGEVKSAGTPRRLAVWVEQVALEQPDLDEEVLGPPARVAFDAEGKPTKAAQAFAQKLGIEVGALARKDTEKGEYLVGRRREKGAPARELLPAALGEVCGKIPFKKSMRWSDGEVAFGRPVRWLCALLGADELGLSFAGVRSGRTTAGHRFLAPGVHALTDAKSYVAELRQRHVFVELDERRRTMVERLHAAAKAAGGSLIEDEFLVEENLSLVEEPHIVTGSFDPEFLKLPERVILDVAKGHQRYFGVRDPSGKLLPKYLAVVNTAEKPDNVRRGNDRVMRARLADAKFFYETDLAHPLAERRAKLDGVVFHKRLGSVGDKVKRVERLVPLLGAELGLPAATIEIAVAGAGLAKCDLVTLMVGELPELQGEMGMAYALAQGVKPEVARVIAEHYQPRSADDPTAPSDAAALVGMADRLDTLVGCFAIGQVPTGAADPLALRRAALGVLRTVLDKSWELSLSASVASAYAAYAGVKLDGDVAETGDKLLAFFKQRLRGLLEQELPADAVDACLAVHADRPHDVALRARALAQLDAQVRASAGEVFKRAANIAKDAPDGEPVAPGEVVAEVHASEAALFAAFAELRKSTGAAQQSRDYPSALGAIATFAPVLGRYFDDILVMAEEPRVRENRLKLMRQIHRTCSAIAHFNLLAG